VALVIVATAVLNLGLGFALAIYASRRYQLLAMGGANSPPDAVFGFRPSPTADPASTPAPSAEAEPAPADMDGASVEGLQKKVEEFHQQLTDVEAVIGQT
jgi:hypothetical protein